MIGREFQISVRKKLRDRMNDLADTVSTGGVGSWDEYRHLVGQIEGLAFAERIFLDEIEESEKRD